MNIREMLSQLRPQIPAQGTTNDACAEYIAAAPLIAQHNGKVLGYIVEEYVQRVCGGEIGFRVQNSVSKNRLVWGEGEVVRVAGAEELHGCFH